jgi:hypothetical protein
VRGTSAAAVRSRSAGSFNSGRAMRGDIGARAEQMEGFRICSQCGTDHFTQRPVPRRG